MDIILLGTGTGVPSLRRGTPCIFMNLGGRYAVFDTGPGSLKNILTVGIDSLNIDLIFYTHLHLDHIAEFSAILFAAKIPPAIRKKSLYVYGPVGIKEYYTKIRELYKETIYTDSYKLTIEEIENKTVHIDSFTISTKTLKHHNGSMGYRIVTDTNRSVVYSGDTDYCNELVEFSKDADLLILECSFPDEFKMSGHLTPTTAGRVAQQSNVKKLVLVHLYPICGQYDILAQCEKEFNGEIVVGEDMMKFEVL